MKTVTSPFVVVSAVQSRRQRDTLVYDATVPYVLLALRDVPTMFVKIPIECFRLFARFNTIKKIKLNLRMTRI